MKKFRYILLAMVLAVFAGAVLAACSDDDRPEPVVCPDPDPEPVSRVVLVYMSANNNLGGYFDRNDLMEMKQAAMAGDLGGGRLLVYHHGLDDSETAVEQRLYEIMPDGSERTLAEYDNELSSVSMERMGQVLDDAERLAPADSRGLMLWSHADGWLNAGFENPEESFGAAQKGFGQDGTKKMSISTLGRVLDGRYFDFVYFDCCYMASVEVMYELRESAGLFAASAAELPADGARYHEALRYLFAPELDLVSAVKVSFDFYLGSASGCTLSVVRSDALDQLAAATAGIYDMRPEQPSKGVVQQFQNTGNNYFDFDHYIECLLAGDQVLYDGWKRALDDAVVFQGATERINMVNRYNVNRHCGLTTHILFTPGDASKQAYSQLKWYRDVASRLYAE